MTTAYRRLLFRNLNAPHPLHPDSRHTMPTNYAIGLRTLRASFLPTPSFTTVYTCSDPIDSTADASILPAIHPGDIRTYPIATSKHLPKSESFFFPFFSFYAG